ncbi:hypothetical protein [Raoultella terrigena]|uniref:Uncharacterized protein n=1 Tax=Raoultella terrigena TaxID=577 RepID=A0AAQ0BNG1_RAOTE|nr:hypothetical protein [Raoultella terrigena]QPF09398.1 hypothetical protein IMO34_02885 [Raoultella terrigena]
MSWTVILLSVPSFSFYLILCAESKNPAEAGFSEELKLAAKPRSFHEERRGQSFALSVPSLSFCLILCAESKNPAEAGFSEELKLAAKPRSFHEERRGQSFSFLSHPFLSA